MSAFGHKYIRSSADARMEPKSRFNLLLIFGCHKKIAKRSTQNPNSDTQCSTNDEHWVSLLGFAGLIFC